MEVCGSTFSKEELEESLILSCINVACPLGDCWESSPRFLKELFGEEAAQVLLRGPAAFLFEQGSSFSPEAVAVLHAGIQKRLTNLNAGADLRAGRDVQASDVAVWTDSMRAHTFAILQRLSSKVGWVHEVKMNSADVAIPWGGGAQQQQPANATPQPSSSVSSVSSVMASSSPSIPSALVAANILGNNGASSSSITSSVSSSGGCEGNFLAVENKTKGLAAAAAAAAAVTSSNSSISSGSNNNSSSSSSSLEITLRSSKGSIKTSTAKVFSGIARLGGSSTSLPLTVRDTHVTLEVRTSRGLMKKKLLGTASLDVSLMTGVVLSNIRSSENGNILASVRMNLSLICPQEYAVFSGQYFDTKKQENSVAAAPAAEQKATVVDVVMSNAVEVSSQNNNNNSSELDELDSHYRINPTTCSGNNSNFDNGSCGGSSCCSSTSNKGTVISKASEKVTENSSCNNNNNSRIEQESTKVNDGGNNNDSNSSNSSLQSKKRPSQPSLEFLSRIVGCDAMHASKLLEPLIIMIMRNSVASGQGLFLDTVRVAFLQQFCLIFSLGISQLYLCYLFILGRLSATGAPVDFAGIGRVVTALRTVLLHPSTPPLTETEKSQENQIMSLLTPLARQISYRGDSWGHSIEEPWSVLGWAWCMRGRAAPPRAPPVQIETVETALARCREVFLRFSPSTATSSSSSSNSAVGGSAAAAAVKNNKSKQEDEKMAASNSSSSSSSNQQQQQQHQQQAGESNSPTGGGEVLSKLSMEVMNHNALLVDSSSSKLSLPALNRSSPSASPSTSPSSSPSTSPKLTSSGSPSSSSGHHVHMHSPQSSTSGMEFIFHHAPEIGAVDGVVVLPPAAGGGGASGVTLPSMSSPEFAGSKFPSPPPSPLMLAAASSRNSGKVSPSENASPPISVVSSTRVVSVSNVTTAAAAAAEDEPMNNSPSSSPSDDDEDGSNNNNTNKGSSDASSSKTTTTAMADEINIPSQEALEEAARALAWRAPLSDAQASTCSSIFALLEEIATHASPDCRARAPLLAYTLSVTLGADFISDIVIPLLRILVADSAVDVRCAVACTAGCILYAAIVAQMEDDILDNIGLILLKCAVDEDVSVRESVTESLTPLVTPPPRASDGCRAFRVAEYVVCRLARDKSDVVRRGALRHIAVICSRLTSPPSQAIVLSLTALVIEVVSMSWPPSESAWEGVENDLRSVADAIPILLSTLEPRRWCELDMLVTTLAHCGSGEVRATVADSLGKWPDTQFENAIFAALMDAQQQQQRSSQKKRSSSSSSSGHRSRTQKNATATGGNSLQVDIPPFQQFMQQVDLGRKGSNADLLFSDHNKGSDSNRDSSLLLPTTTTTTPTTVKTTGFSTRHEQPFSVTSASDCGTCSATTAVVPMSDESGSSSSSSSSSKTCSCAAPGSEATPSSSSSSSAATHGDDLTATTSSRKKRRNSSSSSVVSTSSSSSDDDAVVVLEHRSGRHHNAKKLDSTHAYVHGTQSGNEIFLFPAVHMDSNNNSNNSNNPSSGSRKTSTHVHTNGNIDISMDHPRLEMNGISSNPHTTDDDFHHIQQQYFLQQQRQELGCIEARGLVTVLDSLFYDPLPEVRTAAVLAAPRLLALASRAMREQWIPSVLQAYAAANDTFIQEYNSAALGLARCFPIVIAFFVIEQKRVASADAVAAMTSLLAGTNPLETSHSSSNNNNNSNSVMFDAAGTATLLAAADRFANCPHPEIRRSIAACIGPVFRVLGSGKLSESLLSIVRPAVVDSDPGVRFAALSHLPIIFQAIQHKTAIATEIMEIWTTRTQLWNTLRLRELRVKLAPELFRIVICHHQYRRRRSGRSSRNGTENNNATTDNDFSLLDCLEASDIINVLCESLLLDSFACVRNIALEVLPKFFEILQDGYRSSPKRKVEEKAAAEGTSGSAAAAGAAGGVVAPTASSSSSSSLSVSMWITVLRKKLIQGIASVLHPSSASSPPPFRSSKSSESILNGNKRQSPPLSARSHHHNSNANNAAILAQSTISTAQRQGMFVSSCELILPLLTPEERDLLVVELDRLSGEGKSIAGSKAAELLKKWKSPTLDDDCNSFEIMHLQRSSTILALSHIVEKQQQQDVTMSDVAAS